MDISIFFNALILLGCVLFVGALSGYFSERVGIANIAVNGYMILGALIFTILSNVLPIQENHGYTFLIAFLLAGLSGILVSFLFGFGTIKLKGDHIVVGIGINLLLGGLGLFLSPTLGGIYSKTPNLRNNYLSIEPINNSFFYISTLVILAFVILLGIFSWVYMNKTKYGLRLIATGENPNAVDAQGISVNKMQWIGVILSGFIGAMAGGIFMMSGFGGTFFLGDVQGIGFLAIAIMISGNWQIPIFAIFSVIYATLHSAVQSTSISLDNNIIRLIPYVFTLGIIIIFSKQIVPPKHLGIPFDVQKR